MVPVAILGGGAYAARACEVLAARSDVPALELRLHARDRSRLEVIAAHAARRIGPTHRLRVCLDRDAALAGAAVVVLLIRVGGLAARGHDERFPGEHGLVGDEGVGVGGMANAWRTVPVLEELAARITACAGDALVCNMMAPLGITTRLLVERGCRAIGLCELPAVTLARWSAGVVDAPPLAYAGLNHLGFFWSPAGSALAHPILRTAVARGEVTEELVARFDAVPLHYYVDVFEPVVARQLGRVRRADRARELAALQAVLLHSFAAEPGASPAELARRPTPWFEAALAPAIAAALGGTPYAGPLDVPNAGRLAEVPDAAVVELFGRLDGTGIAIEPVAARPPAVRAMLARLAGAEALLYRASCDRDRACLAEALAALPLELAPEAQRAVLAHITTTVGPEAQP